MNSQRDSPVCPIVFVAIGYLIVAQVWFLTQGIPRSLNGDADFSAFYRSGLMFNSGARHELYSIAAQDRFEGQALPNKHGLPQYFYHPAFEAAMFAPLAKVSYAEAFDIWTILSLGLLIAGALAIELSPFIALAFFPVAFCILQGQDSLLLFAIIAFAYRHFVKNNDVATGLLLGLALFKFQIALPLAFVVFLLVPSKRRFLLSFLSTGMGLAFISLAEIGYSGMRFYWQNIFALGSKDSWNMPNIRGIVETAGGDRVIVVVLSVALMMGIAWLNNGLVERRKIFAIATVTAVLVSYHLHLYDLSVLLIPIALIFSERRICSLSLCAATFFVPIVSTPLYLLALNNRFAYVFALPICVLLILFTRSSPHGQGYRTAGAGLARKTFPRFSASIGLPES